MPARVATGMPVVFGPYLKRARQRARKRVVPGESEEESEGENEGETADETKTPVSSPKRKFALGVLVGAALALLWRRKRS